jgi:hypothetical protein
MKQSELLILENQAMIMLALANITTTEIIYDRLISQMERSQKVLEFLKARKKAQDEATKKEGE